MKTLISPREVARIAFASANGIDELISEPMIISAQQRFLRPVLGRLYDRLERGDCIELLEMLIKPALAYYVKLAALPALAAQTGAAGVVSYRNANLSPASTANMAALRKSVRAEAVALIKLAVAHIENHPDLYPEYDPHNNVMNRVSIGSQVVM
jgi:hypothetical protein